MDNITNNKNPINYIGMTITKYFEKLLVVLASICIFVISVIILNTPFVTGYELTIYSAYPFYFWLLLALAFGCGIIILIREAFSEGQTKWWLGGFLIVIVCNIIFLALPFFRGYTFFPGGDAQTHVGMMKDIIITGHIGNLNHYPVVHLLGTYLLLITGISENAVTSLLFISWNILYLVGIYALAITVSKNRGQALLVTALAAPLTYSYLSAVLHPSMFSLYLLPMLLYVFIKTLKSSTQLFSFNFCLVILAIVMTLAHPVTCIYAMLLMVALIISGIFYRKISRRQNAERSLETNSFKPFRIILIMAVIFILWYLPFTYIQGSINQVFDFLIESNAQSLYTQQTSQLFSAGITPFQTIEIIFYRYGAIIIYGVIAVFSVLIVIFGLRKHKPISKDINFRFTILFVISLVASVFSLYGFTGEYDPVRVARFVIFIAPILSGLIMYDFLMHRHSSMITKQFSGKVLIGALALLIVVAGTISIFSVYGSPSKVEHNFQIGKKDLAGTKWLTLHQERDYVITTGNLTFLRYDDFNFGVETSPYAKANLDSKSIPSDYDFSSNDLSYITQAIGEERFKSYRYVLLTQQDRVSNLLVPENVRARAHDYFGSGYKSFISNPMSSKIYTNSGFEAWLVK